MGELSEWFKEHAWKVCIPQKGIEGSNPSLSAKVYIEPGSAGFFIIQKPTQAMLEGGFLYNEKSFEQQSVQWRL